MAEIDNAEFNKKTTEISVNIFLDFTITPFISSQNSTIYKKNKLFICKLAIKRILLTKKPLGIIAIIFFG